MNQKSSKSLPLAAILALAAAAPAAAQTKYNQYVALGDSLTAGWQSGCLVQRNQVNSYPAQLAAILYNGTFEQPLVAEVPVSGSGAPECLGAVFVPPATVTVEPLSQMGNPLNGLLPMPYNNLGMPGAEVADLTQLTSVNPNGSSIEMISALVLRNFPGSPFNNTNAVDQATILLAPAAGSALTTLWIGNNNTLGASTSGIVVDGATLISQSDFKTQYDAIIAGLPSGIQLVVANIPDVTAIPFSTTIPPILVDPTTMQPVIVSGSTVPLLGQGDSAFPCTPVPPDQGCALPAGTLVNLPASSLLAAGVGVPVAAGGTGQPLPHGFIDSTGTPHSGVTLYPDDITLLKQRTGDYNSVIASDSGNAVMVDANAVLGAIAVHGYSIGGITLTSAFLTGGVFSFDGVHPSTIGYTIVATEFIKAINAQTSSNFPQPSFANALFTPNPPNPGTAAGSSVAGGAWGYTYDMWRDVLASTHSADVAAAMVLPSLPQAPRVAPSLPSSPRTARRVERRDTD